MTSWWRILLAFLFLSAILIAGTGARPPAQSQITINYPSITGPTWPLYVAIEGGYYAKYGLDVNLVYGEHPAGIAMIVSDEADYDQLRTRTRDAGKLKRRFPCGIWEPVQKEPLRADGWQGDPKDSRSEG